MSNRKASTTLNPDKYVMVFLSLDEAQAGDRESGLVTVQSFDAGDFSGMSELDTTRWAAGQVIKATCYLRVEERKPERQAPVSNRTFGVIGSEASTAAEDQPL
jgi:hypothetical protein